MKKINKISKAKSGFTLLEVLLASVILVIASTMIMKGFIAVMFFAANNKRFVKQADLNNRQATSYLANYATGSQSSTIAGINAGDDTRTNHDTITFVLDTTVPAGMVNNMYVATEEFVDQGGLRSATGALYPINYDNIEISAETNATNRYAFFYDFGDAYHCSDLDHEVRYGCFGWEPAVDDSGNRVLNQDGSTLYIPVKPGFYCFDESHPDDYYFAVDDEGNVTTNRNCIPRSVNPVSEE